MRYAKEILSCGDASPCHWQWVVRFPGERRLPNSDVSVDQSRVRALCLGGCEISLTTS
uniref:Uncharacterized protein n=1 Tax=Helianthus annuus TaxID=4232 RepID=A0A251V8C3_HELAN